MRAVAILILLAAIFHAGNAAKSQYVEPNSVHCVTSGVDFALSEDESLSDLWAETKFDVDLYTGSDYQKVLDGDFDKTTGKVTLPYDRYRFDAATIYGPNARPVMYNIEQPFLAVPHPGVSKRNYTFGVYCTISAAYHVDLITNTTDDGHGDHGGDVVRPEDHVQATFLGLRADNSTVLGDKLVYTLHLKDDQYASFLPVTCNFFNPEKDNEIVPVVSDRCPRQFDPSIQYLSAMKRIDVTTYELNFWAFQFDTQLDSMLGITCDLMLCVTPNIGECYKDCWGGAAPTGYPTGGPTQGPTTEEPTGPTEPTGRPTTPTGAPTTEAPTEATTEAPPTAEPTTEAPPSSEAPPPTSEAPPTTVAPPTTEAPPTEEPTSEAPTSEAPTESVPARHKREANAAPDSGTKKTVFAVRGAAPDERPTEVCTDKSLLNALYGIVGGLAALVVILIFSLLYLVHVGRRRKAEHGYVSS